MPLGIISGEGRPFIRFAIQENRWEKSSEDGPVDFDPSVPFLMDVERAEGGWLMVSTGVRDWKSWGHNDASKAPPKPGTEYKQAYSVLCYGAKAFGDDQVYELCSNQKAMLTFVAAVFERAEGQFGSGKVPLVKITGSKPIKIGKGKSRDIHFEIVKYVDRPEAFDEAKADAPVAADEWEGEAELADAEY